MMTLPDTDKVMGAKYCSYRIGGPLDEPYLPTTLDEAFDILKDARQRRCQLTVLGTGSNTLIASQGIRGITFLSKRLMFVEIVDSQTLHIGAGMPLAKVCKLAQEKALTGVEFMIGVPGTLGGAVTMNAGATGQDTATVLDFANVYNLETGELTKMSHADLQFAYRKSAIQPHWIILSAQLRLQQGDPQAILALIQKNLDFRQTHHPKEPNGGSVFKNPSPEMPCGRMLDESGAKGWHEGGAMISPMHANFIVNTGNATSTDVLKLMLRMKTTIKARYGLDVYPENRFLGDATDEEKQLWKDLTGHDWRH